MTGDRFNLLPNFYLPIESDGPDHPVLFPKPPPEVVVERGPISIGSQSGHPSLGGVEAEDAEGRKIVVIAYEWPEPIRFMETREETERHQLERFLNDYGRVVGSAPFVTYRRGTDRPDFFVETDQGEVGLDIAQLVVQKRVRAHRIFDNVRRAALERGPGVDTPPMPPVSMVSPGAAGA